MGWDLSNYLSSCKVFLLFACKYSIICMSLCIINGIIFYWVKGKWSDMMDRKIAELMVAMIEYDKGDARRIQHFVKVHDLAAAIKIGRAHV